MARKVFSPLLLVTIYPATATVLSEACHPPTYPEQV